MSLRGRAGGEVAGDRRWNGGHGLGVSDRVQRSSEIMFSKSTLS
ncbi:hypothetical protein ZOSMA_13G00650 [Zostera marina]|uniref:Uncharacterized protein n=1 Tax=Zostera marina TaxID=29655 RepID=A0A0K9PXX0_ZOSMR|nr:hypothetical protein ZOSMA_13G00650 [Zostera marina]